MWLSILCLLVGFALLIGGGELLVRGAVRLADALGISPLVVGIVIVGFGTSAPELVASIEAARIGSPSIAWGNIVGSNLANTLLILGATAIIGAVAVERGPLWRDGGLVLMASIALWWMAKDGNVGQIFGAIMVLVLFCYLAFAYWQESRVAHGLTAASDRADAREGLDPDLHRPRFAPLANRPKLRAVLVLLIGLVAIIAGGRMLVTGAADLARTWGMSETVIGLTIVAIGTSMPELVTSVIAARRGQGEVAIGNVMGSNIYNILGIGGTVAIIAPGGFPLDLADGDLGLLAGSALLMILFAASHYRISRREGFALLSLYLGYTIYKLATAS